MPAGSTTKSARKHAGRSLLLGSWPAADSGDFRKNGGPSREDSSSTDWNYSVIWGSSWDFIEGLDFFFRLLGSFFSLVVRFVTFMGFFFVTVKAFVVAFNTREVGIPTECLLSQDGDFFLGFAFGIEVGFGSIMVIMGASGVEGYNAGDMYTHTHTTGCDPC
ncbi:hypothetical protein F4778DRAFT_754284 [Xylariomycetidae sp. FL2044]|nr:hypothetical protein F4778DRAFT_754284 [Xylariomycetidae sp. FL2044]